MDKAEADGTRNIATSSATLYQSMFSAASFQLGCIAQDDGEIIYILYFTLDEGKMQIDKGRKLLIKLENDSIVELESATKIGPADYTFDVDRGVTSYYVKPLYIISEEDIENICKGNAKKIRIENNIGNIDREIKKNNFSTKLEKMYAVIKEALSEKKDVYSGF
ncbi:MAG: hypothetical protein LUI08_01985 [Prevotella sp.]|nr:hypothetical protein [Prevotella sp.]